MASTISLFSDTPHAKDAVQELKKLGFTNDEITVMVKDNSSVGAQDGQNAVSAGVTTGVATGGIAGAMAGLFVGLGLITIPGIGPFLAAGPLLASLGITGAAATTTMGAAAGAVTGGVAGGIAGALTKAGLSREQAEKYQKRLQEGAVLVGVNTDRIPADVVSQVMTTFGAETIDRTL